MSDNISIKQRIFDAIASNRAISRIRLAEKYHIRLATVTEVTRQLLTDGVIREAGEDNSTGGRKPVLLEINSEAFYTIGITLTRNHLTGGLFNAASESKLEVSFPTNENLTGDDLLALLKKTVDRLLKASEIKPEMLKGIGIGFPANVEKNTGIYNGATYYPLLKGVKVKDFLSEKYHVPVIVDHDVVLMTMAEYYLSALNVPDNFAVLFIGSGIGCRFIIDGEIYRGVSNRASEFGHLSLRHDGPPCYCGNRGCFERLASIEAIEQAYGSGKDFSQIVKLAKGNDEKALAVFRQTAEYIALAIANIQNLMDVDMVIINGDIVAARDVLIRELHRQLQLKTLHRREIDLEKVFISDIGSKVATVGPAVMAADCHFLSRGINIFPRRKV